MADFWITTADMYSTLFDKPKMIEKLLQRPPFKYIFDIIMETIKQTGYAKGLYKDDELDGNYYCIKDRKIFFLQKIIYLTSMTLNEQLQVQPIKIVAGLEPELTNVLLQAIYRAAMNCNNSDLQVEQILAAIGASPIQYENIEENQSKKPIITQQEQISSVQNKQIELKNIINNQQVYIQELEKELQKKTNIILNQEQQIQELKKQLEQITNSDIFPLQFQEDIQNQSEKIQELL